VVASSAGFQTVHATSSQSRGANPVINWPEAWRLSQSATKVRVRHPLQEVPWRGKPP